MLLTKLWSTFEWDKSYVIDSAVALRVHLLLPELISNCFWSLSSSVLNTSDQAKNLCVATDPKFKRTQLQNLVSRVQDISRVKIIWALAGLALFLIDSTTVMVSLQSSLTGRSQLRLIQNAAPLYHITLLKLCFTIVNITLCFLSVVERCRGNSPVWFSLNLTCNNLT